MNPRISSLGSRIYDSMKIGKLITISFISPVATLIPVGVIVGISDGICAGVLVGVCEGICEGVCVGEIEKILTKHDIFKLLDNNYHVILQFQNLLQIKN